MIRRSDITVLPDGTTPEPGIYITVKNGAGSLATLYEDDGSALGNPIISGTGGAFHYNIASSAYGPYTEEYRVSLSESPRTVAAVYLVDQVPITVVAADIANVDIVAGSIANVNAVGPAIASVSAVAGDLANINLVAADLPNINAAYVYAQAAQTSAAAVAGIVLTGTGISVPCLTVEAYASAKASGVVGDGTDDGPALAAASAALSAIGGGVLYLYPGRTYWVGSQTHNGSVPAGTYTWAPSTFYSLNFVGCTKSVTLMSNGAIIKCLAGKRFGTFDDAGNPMATGSGYTGTGISTPYGAMLNVENCSGGFYMVGQLELDGNIANAAIGGNWGDAGRQLPMSGVRLEGNTGPVDINVYSHHHGLDGGTGDGPGAINVREQVTIRGRFVNNGRNNFSLVGGNGWNFEGASLTGAGKNLGGTMTYSPPGAGLDLEAEGGRYVINTTLRKCIVSDNIGVGLIRDSSTNTYAVNCYDCAFIGTTNFSLWPNGPRMRFHDCLILGTMVNCYAHADATLACQFYRCRFDTDLSLSPTGVLNLQGGARFFDNGGGSLNLYFEECKFNEVAAAGNFLTVGSGWFHNCDFQAAVAGWFQASGQFSGPKTRFTNTSALPRNDLAGTLAVNYAGPSLDSFIFNGTRYEADTDRATGKLLYYGSATYNPPSLALGAAASIQTMALTGVALGDKVEDVSFSVNLAGTRIMAWASAANTVSYYFINENGANPLDLASGTIRVKVRQA